MIRWPAQIVAIVALAALVPGAAAHAALQMVDPPIDKSPRLAAPPTEFTLSFTEHLDVSASSLQVWNTTAPAHEVDLGPPTITRDPPVMKVALPSGLPAGTYVVDYNAVSADDGHPNEGSIPFAIGPAPAAKTSTTSATKSSPPVELPIILLATAAVAGARRRTGA